jgi:hypothetical protein
MKVFLLLLLPTTSKEKEPRLVGRNQRNNNLNTLLTKIGDVKEEDPLKHSRQLVVFRHRNHIRVKIVRKEEYRNEERIPVATKSTTMKRRTKK